MKISIIIPNFNGHALLTDCFSSIATAARYYPQICLECLLIDNNSTDSSQQIFENICKKYPILSGKFIQQPKNLGFAGAVNIGIKKSKYPHLFILNNDIKLQKDWFKIISKNIESHPKFSVFYGLVLNKDGQRIESEGFEYSMSGLCQNISNTKSFKKSSRKTTQIWGAPASAIIYRKSALKKVGLFDHRFFAYIEDVDLAYRLAKNNIKTLYVPQAVSYHLGGATSSKMGNLRAKMTYRNWHYLIIKNYSISDIIFNLPSITIQRLKNLKYFYQSTPKPRFIIEYLQTNLQICQFALKNLVKSTSDDHWN